MRDDPSEHRQRISGRDISDSTSIFGLSIFACIISTSGMRPPLSVVAKIAHEQHLELFGAWREYYSRVHRHRSSTPQAELAFVCCIFALTNRMNADLSDKPSANASALTGLPAHISTAS
jgi:hypothetical protein